jgi:hypothetical protein
MKSLYYIIALILILGWAIAFIGYGEGGFIHILLVPAMILVVIRTHLEMKLAHKYSA